MDLLEEKLRALDRSVTEFEFALKMLVEFGNNRNQALLDTARAELIGAAMSVTFLRKAIREKAAQSVGVAVVSQ
jgi:hypothetical protein